MFQDGVTSGGAHIARGSLIRFCYNVSSSLEGKSMELSSIGAMVIDASRIPIDAIFMVGTGRQFTPNDSSYDN